MSNTLLIANTDAFGLPSAVYARRNLWWDLVTNLVNQTRAIMGEYKSRKEMACMLEWEDWQLRDTGIERAQLIELLNEPLSVSIAPKLRKRSR